MIPKIIHYCWFGKGQMPRLATKCIESWKKHLPDYEIKEWNEDNFNIDITKYTHEAYDAGKYAFVSDYARMWILYNHGGIYFDTDVEVIDNLTDIISTGNFMGCEIDGGNGNISVGPGLGLATEKGNIIYKQILDVYENLNFREQDGKINPYAIVRITTDILLQNGLTDQKGIQNVCNTTIYPAEYFNPMDSLTGKIIRTANTKSIHHYMNSWSTPADKMRNCIGKLIRRIIR